MKVKVVIDDQAYEVEVEDIHERPVIAKIQGERYEVWPEKVRKPTPAVSVPEPTQAPAPVGQEAPGKDLKEVTAPLPGVVVSVLVEPGDTVSRGQELCTLEAMKMKNAIMSSRDGVIASVDVSVGEQVNQGQVLMSYSA